MTCEEEDDEVVDGWVCLLARFDLVDNLVIHNVVHPRQRLVLFHQVDRV